MNHFHVLDMMSLHNTLLHSMNVIKGTLESGTGGWREGKLISHPGDGSITWIWSAGR